MQPPRKWLVLVRIADETRVNSLANLAAYLYFNFGGFAMGGMGGEIRGKSKLETYKKFRARINRKKIEDGTGLHMDAGNGSQARPLQKHEERPRNWRVVFTFISASRE